MLRLPALVASAAMLIAVAVAPAPANAAADLGGTIEGTLTTAKGDPVAGILLQITSPTVKSDQLPQTWTDEAGHYALTPLPAGRYRIGFYFPETLSTQWVPRKARESQATWFTVRDGETITVDESLFPTGALEITYQSRDGSGPVPAFCGEVIGTLYVKSGCTETGVLRLADLPVDDYLIAIYDGGWGWAGVTEDATTPVEVFQE